MNMNRAKDASTAGVSSNQLVGVIVLAALLFLFLVRMGFRGLVITP